MKYLESSIMSTFCFLKSFLEISTIAVYGSVVRFIFRV